ncbi:MAG: hypothetical protein JOZ02_23315 [Acidobacteria bacterium]|nr:hypothetical protein [Acidobacteriota bacterium]
MRRTLSAAVLVLAFCCPVSAGVIHNPPPEPLLAGAVTATADAEVSEPGVSDGLTESAFELLVNLPTLL